jgi:trans-aconitate 2-methyltransferase
MSDPAERTYTYGDSEVAGDRLAMIATIFGPTTAEFLRRDGRADPRTGRAGAALAIDLGCGPGYTTTLVHQEVGATRTIGLERSEAFVLRARVEHTTDGIGFQPHDVTMVPFPTGSADVIFARYLLAHLPDPVTVRDRWLTQVRPGGRLLVEEIDHIDTSVDTFGRYLDVVQQMSRGHDTELLVGPTLAAAAPPDGTALVADSVALISPRPQTVARIFAMNLSVWRDDPWVVDHIDPAVVAALAAELADLRTAAPVAGITWHHRQLTYERD